MKISLPLYTWTFFCNAVRFWLDEALNPRVLSARLTDGSLAELVDAHDSKSCAARHPGSTPGGATIFFATEFTLEFPVSAIRSGVRTIASVVYPLQYMSMAAAFSAGSAGGSFSLRGQAVESRKRFSHPVVRTGYGGFLNYPACANGRMGQPLARILRMLMSSSGGKK